MPQLLPPSANTLTRWSLVVSTIFLVALISVLVFWARTDRNRVGVPVAQPVAFQHSLHAGELGVDCRYCHTSVEVAASANIPPTEVCMTCHSQIRVGSPQLAPVYASWGVESGAAPTLVPGAESQPLQWNRVHDLADFVYFNHSAHINNGVGCSSCHGRVDQMAEIWKAQPLSMGWCLECHRNPAQNLRPQSEIFNMAYSFPENQDEIGPMLVEQYNINADALANCSICHR